MIDDPGDNAGSKSLDADPTPGNGVVEDAEVARRAGRQSLSRADQAERLKESIYLVGPVGTTEGGCVGDCLATPGRYPWTQTSTSSARRRVSCSVPRELTTPTRSNDLVAPIQRHLPQRRSR
ncbi:hypothetical protein [Flexivirga caeni]|uniref:Uncharacterized protein n=1 Tax=Flexivirga caeni TaxID=2294115 RepID=A0A3M9MDY8_9MICO|nr:hypothetical protein [Flexivirga caeni]RNI22818.1 hypothetical protein EFY87_08350 [Flexivirga caeni]